MAPPPFEMLLAAGPLFARDGRHRRFVWWASAAG